MVVGRSWRAAAPHPVALESCLSFAFPLPNPANTATINQPAGCHLSSKPKATPTQTAAHTARPSNSPLIPNGHQSSTPSPFPRPFSSLFNKTPHHRRFRPPVSNSSKGLLPLPSHPPFTPPVPEPGWTTVSHRKKRPFSSTPQHRPPPPPPLCFYCRSSSHMARDCPHGDFICFFCHGKGHISKDCPKASTASSSAPILPIPAVTAGIIQDLHSYAIFYLAQGNPSVPEIREMLSYRFNVRNWTSSIKPAAGTSFMVQFPSSEILEQALDLKLVDMGTFKGRFLRWREDLRLATLPKPFLTWVRILRLPYHLWQWEFILSLFKDVGECITSSEDVAFRAKFRDCKVLLKVRDLADIPKKITFRYVSPIDGSLLEGFIVTQIIGRQISERDFEKPEVQEHEAKWEGNPSTESGWVDRGPDDIVVDQQPQNRRPSPRPPLPTPPPPPPNKGKGIDVISSANLNSALPPRARSPVKSNHLTLGPPPSVFRGAEQDVDLIDVMWDGRNLTVDKSLWMSFLQAQGIGASSFPVIRQAPIIARSAAPSSSSSPSPQSQSKTGSVPPGFEHFAAGKKKRSVSKARVRRALAHKAFIRHLSASRSLSSTKHSKSSSSSSISTPINNASDLQLTTVLSNCGALDPVPADGLLSLRALEKGRAESSQ